MSATSSNSYPRLITPVDTAANYSSPNQPFIEGPSKKSLRQNFTAKASKLLTPKQISATLPQLNPEKLERIVAIRFHEQYILTALTSLELFITDLSVSNLSLIFKIYLLSFINQQYVQQQTTSFEQYELKRLEITKIQSLKESLQDKLKHFQKTDEILENAYDQITGVYFENFRPKLDDLSCVVEQTLYAIDSRFSNIFTEGVKKNSNIGVFSKKTKAIASKAQATIKHSFLQSVTQLSGKSKISSKQEKNISICDSYELVGAEALSTVYDKSLPLMCDALQYDKNTVNNLDVPTFTSSLSPHTVTSVRYLIKSIFISFSEAHIGLTQENVEQNIRNKLYEYFEISLEAMLYETNHIPYVYLALFSEYFTSINIRLEHIEALDKITSRYGYIWVEFILCEKMKNILFFSGARRYFQSVTNYNSDERNLSYLKDYTKLKLDYDQLMNNPNTTNFIERYKLFIRRLCCMCENINITLMDLLFFYKDFKHETSKTEALKKFPDQALSSNDSDEESIGDMSLEYDRLANSEGQNQQNLEDFEIIEDIELDEFQVRNSVYHCFFSFLKPICIRNLEFGLETNDIPLNIISKKNQKK